MDKDLEFLYEKAVEEPFFRQKFVNSLDLGDIKSNVSKIIVKTKQKEDLIMRCSSIFVGTKAKIKIYPLAFDKEIHLNFYDFLSTLRDHEIYHVFENYCYGNVISKREKEINANKNVLKNINPKNSLEYIKFIKEQIKAWNE